MQIPLVDLQAQYHAIRGAIDEAIAAVIKDSAFIGGPYVERFEAAFASFCGTRHAVGVSSGTDALRLALIACGVRPGDEVITVPNTFIATTEAISMAGAGIRFVDVDRDSLNMDPELLEPAISPRTRAIIPVHLYGRPAAMDPILAIARHHGIKVIADAAQAHGAYYRGQKIGKLGDAVCFSFYPGKNLGAYGDAGAVVTDDQEIRNTISMLRDHGRKRKYEHELEGFNCRMDGLQGAILSAKLPYLEEWTRTRVAHAARYNQLLRNIQGVKIPSTSEESVAVFHLYVIQVDPRSAIQSHLKKTGIATGVHYPIPLHRQPAYSYLKQSQGSFPVTEELAERILSLPLYPELTSEQIETVAAEIERAIAHAHS